ncbi:MAG: hypothetical protein WAK93_09000 [Solirubrobacteraceae bacterium]
MRARPVALGVVTAVAIWLTGCGLNIQSPDLFVLTRTGQGPKLTMLVNDSGTISCDGAKPKPISDARLIQARDLSDDLVKDASHNLTIASEPGTIYYYRIRVQQGTVSFPDRAAPGHKELEEAELFAAQAATQACGRGG